MRSWRRCNAAANARDHAASIVKGTGMAGKQSQLTSLKIRKQLLSVESELNRAQLFNECRDFKNEIHLLKNQMESDLSFFASGAKVAMSLAVIDTAFTDQDRGKKISRRGFPLC